MQTFRTELFIDENPEKISYDSRILSIGSEFSHSMVKHLQKYRFFVNSNPYGTIYNPLSIYNLLSITSGARNLDEGLITESGGVWNHFDFHFKPRSGSKEELLAKLRRTVSDTRTYLQNTDFLVLTFGSAHVYTLDAGRHVVANCHKAPSSLFGKRVLSTEEIVEGFRAVYSKLNNIREIVLVVSPVMHTKVSLPLNCVSKAVLRLACHEIVNEFPHVKYFPAYEFLLDDLRDYRYYEKDFIHPNELAIEYIFGKFLAAYVDSGDQEVLTTVESILEAIDHVPYNPQSEEYQQYILDALEKLGQLGTRIDLTELEDQLRSRLKG